MRPSAIQATFPDGLLQSFLKKTKPAAEERQNRIWHLALQETTQEVFLSVLLRGEVHFDSFYRLAGCVGQSHRALPSAEFVDHLEHEDIEPDF